MKRFKIINKYGIEEIEIGKLKNGYVLEKVSFLYEGDGIKVCKVYRDMKDFKLHEMNDDILSYEVLN